MTKFITTIFTAAILFSVFCNHANAQSRQKSEDDMVRGGQSAMLIATPKHSDDPGIFKMTLDTAPSEGTLLKKLEQEFECMEWIDIEKDGIGVVYACEYWVEVDWNTFEVKEGSNFGILNPETGEFTVIKEYCEDIVSMAWDPTTDIVYATTHPYYTGITSFGTIDLETGEFSLIAQIGSNIVPIAIDNNGEAYALRLGESGPTGTAKLDLKTGELTALEDVVFQANYVQNFEVDRESNELYWAARGSVASSKWLKIEKETGSITELGTFPENRSVVSFTIVGGSFGDICDAVQNLEYSLLDSGLSLTWKAPEGHAPDSYKVYKGLTEIAVTSELSYVVTSLTEGTHKFSVAAIYNDEECFPKRVSVAVTLEPCAGIDNLTVAYTDDCRAELTWGVEKKCNIYRDGVIIASGITDSGYTDNDFDTGQPHEWSVSAVCQGGVESGKTTTAKELCQVVAVETASSQAVRLFPNPATSFINITGEDICKVEVYTPMGQLIKTLSNAGSIDVSSFASGMYLVRIYSSDSQVITQRFMVTR